MWFTSSLLVYILHCAHCIPYHYHIMPYYAMSYNTMLCHTYAYPGQARVQTTVQCFRHQTRAYTTIECLWARGKSLHTITRVPIGTRQEPTHHQQSAYRHEARASLSYFPSPSAGILVHPLSYSCFRIGSIAMKQKEIGFELVTCHHSPTPYFLQITTFYKIKVENLVYSPMPVSVQIKL